MVWEKQVAPDICASGVTHPRFGLNRYVFERVHYSPSFHVIPKRTRRIAVSETPYWRAMCVMVPNA